MSNAMDIFLIDGIGPFFRGYGKQQVNWSKVPFQRLSEEPLQLGQQFAQIRRDMDTFAGRVRQIGYNGITLDDVTHLAPDPWLEPEINQKIAVLAEQYRKLFAVCRLHELDVYLTMDVLSFTPGLKRQIGKSTRKANVFIRRQVQTVLQQFPEVKGIILRIGECDGKDVRGDFVSELTLQRPGQANCLLHELLPLFERSHRYLILRNWTVGAYSIGDFIWHRRTLSRVLHGIESEWFILSLKYGESDFFRYLPLNKHFFRSKVKKIIELQARREYEGAGEYPSFIGWDYQEYRRQLAGAENMVGISVWCQTGGWLPFRRLTFLEDAGIWNELNSFVCIQLFRYRRNVEEAVAAFAQAIDCPDPSALLALLRLDDQVIKELLYIEDVAEQKLFFRRIRIPPLVPVFWNNIFINHSVRKVLRTLVGNGAQSVEKGYKALEKIPQMEALAEKCGLPAADIRYMYDTFTLLAVAREYYFLPYNQRVKKRIKKAKKRYKQQYPNGTRPRYRVKTSFKPFALNGVQMRWFLRLALRRKRGYRMVDYFFTLHLLAFAFRGIVLLKPKLIPKFARKKAMGIDTLFK